MCMKLNQRGKKRRRMKMK
ncbi:hypothetical protein E2C01_070831 [Portunus trituberculatus]|uniref:Uncharacterized protein n=1 Tax=Portunus trituberculatus TaxID=210409 RepID=A0A5B7HTS6_PORTR|nr:hypothetical protein [Portunus trituberculatus]